MHNRAGAESFLHKRFVHNRAGAESFLQNRFVHNRGGAESFLHNRFVHHRAGAESFLHNRFLHNRAGAQSFLHNWYVHNRTGAESCRVQSKRCSIILMHNRSVPDRSCWIGTVQNRAVLDRYHPEITVALYYEHVAIYAALYVILSGEIEYWSERVGIPGSRTITVGNFRMLCNYLWMVS